MKTTKFETAKNRTSLPPGGLLRKFATLVFAFVMALSATAANKYWGGPAGSAASPVSGNWDTTSANWSTTATGASSTTFATGDTAVFAGADGSYWINVPANLSAAGIYFTNAGYTLTSSVPVIITTTANAAANVVSGKTAFLGTNVTLSITANGSFVNQGTTLAGVLIVTNGGAITQPNSFAFAVDGAPGSALRILSGGNASHTGGGSAVRIGYTSGSSGILSIEGGVFNNSGTANFVLGAAAASTGTVVIASGALNVTRTPVVLGNGGAAACVATNNLNGGVELVQQIKTSSSANVSIFNFNGGTLKAGSGTLATAFLTGLTTANVRNGGAVIDHNGYDLTIGQALRHSTLAGDAATDGGLIVTNSSAAGSVSLTGANTYNGPTIVRSGAKLVTTTLSTGGGSYLVADGAVLEVQVAAAGQWLASSGLTLGASGSLTNNFTLGANASTTVPAVAASGALNLNGTVYVNVTGSGLTAPNTYLLLSYGSISGAGGFSAVSLPAIAGYIGMLTNDVAAKQLKLVYTQAPQPVKWAVGDGVWDTSALNWQLLAGSSPTNYVENALVTFNDSATGSSPITVTLTDNHTPGWITNNSAKSYILAGGFNITGAPAVNKDGSGTLVVDNGSGNVFGPISISAGTLQLGNADTGGSLGSANLINNGLVAVNRTDAAILANVISGSGDLAQNGSGSVTLTAANTHSGISAVNSGQMILANGAAVQNSTVSNNVAGGVAFGSGITSATFGGLAGAGDLALQNADSAVVTLTVGGNGQATTYTGSLSGNGNLQKTGTNILTLSGNSSLNNLQVTAPGSTLAVTGGDSTVAALQILTDNGTLLVSGGNTTVTTDSRIAGANGVYNVSGGTLNLAKVVIGSASPANTNNQLTVSGTAQVYQNQSGGGTLQQLWIGGNNSGSGALLLKDGASWNNGNASPFDGSGNPIVAVGNVGTGQGVFTIQDNATFYYNNIMRVAWGAQNVGTVNLNGGVCSVAGIDRGSGTGILNVNNGQIQALTATANFFLGFTNTSGSNAVNLVSGKLTFDNNGYNVTLSNVLSGAGGLVSQGGGTLTLAAANTYTGGTVINAGTLNVIGAGSINSSASVSNNASATLDVSTANSQLNIAGTLVLSDSTLITTLASTNIVVGQFGTAGSANTINITTLPAINTVPAAVRVIKYTTAAPGLVDGDNNLTALSTVLPAAASPQGYLTNNAVAKAIDLIITNMIIVANITNQPAADSAYSGGKAHFSVQLEITNSTMHYQWRKAGVPLTDGPTVSGSSADTVHLSNVSAGDAVSYDVIVTNFGGSVTSSPAMLTLLSPTNYEQAAVSAGPVSLYMFQEATDPATGAALAHDYQGDLDGLYGVAALNAYNGTTGPTPADGFPGFDPATMAVRLQGYTTGSHVAIPPLYLNTNTVTLAAWIKPGLPPANCGLIFCRGGGTVAGLDFTGSTDANGNRTLGYTWNNEGGSYGWNSQIAPLPGIWSYVALVITPTNATIYIVSTNGLLSASQPYTHVNQSFAADTWIGDDAFSGGNRQFDGSIYGAAIYAKSLSQSQIQNLYGAASGVSNFAPVIASQPVASQTLYAQQTAVVSALASGSLPLAYQWKYFDGISAYADVVNGGRFSGADTSSLVISNLAVTDATNFVLVATNSFGVVTSSVSALFVNAVQPPEFITNSVVEPNGQDWNTASAWSDGLSASNSAILKPGSSYFIVPGGGLRSPNVSSTVWFPGLVLTNLGDGVYNSTLPAANLGALILKGSGSSYAKLVMAGGELLSFTDNNGPHTVGGTEVNVVANTPIASFSTTGGRSITLNAMLTGSGSVEYIGWGNTTFQTAATTSLNIAGTNNTFTGAWAVEAATLVGSTPGALGTNTITVGTNAALQTTYDIDNTNGTLFLNGRLNLTQNDTFWKVVINGTNLNAGTYSYASLAAQYPANFPATWTGVVGADTATSAAGSLTVLANTIATNSTNIAFTVSGNMLLISWPADHLGWIAQSNSVSLSDPNAWFDIPGSQSSTQLNLTIAPASTNVFYRLRYPSN